MEVVSLRHERYCEYSISVQYWVNGEHFFETTGLKKHRFGKTRSSTTNPFGVELKNAIPLDCLLDDNKNTIELFVVYSFTFPCDQ